MRRSLLFALVGLGACISRAPDDTNGTDLDGDGLLVDQDCDDDDASVGAPPSWSIDGDGDGYGGSTAEACERPDQAVAQAGDCDDGDAGTHPFALEDCGDADRDCDGDPTASAVDGQRLADDADGDGFGDADTVSTRCPGDGRVADATDCDDRDSAVHPTADEHCDAIDEDCDGEIDETPIDGIELYVDADGDGFGDPAALVRVCSGGAGFTDQPGDCDDVDDRFYPGADEPGCPDPNDYDCDGVVAFTDADGDGAGTCMDCDDSDPLRSPFAIEACDGVDNDCDGEVDTDIAQLPTWFPDGDGDGFGDAAAAGVTGCIGPSGSVTDDSDCDDLDPAVSPAALEACTDRVDRDCDGTIPFTDLDGDGFAACLDCDDTIDRIHPSAPETCNQRDDDCDGSVDENPVGATTWYDDVDGDGYGDDATAVTGCPPTSTAVSRGGDCDDGDADRHPQAREPDCSDPTDWNCDGSAGSVDADGDGFFACQECDDQHATAFPGGTETCDGLDDDCDGVVDESDASDASTWFLDADADGYGDPGTTELACAMPGNFAATDDDCDDGDATINPAAQEVCDSDDADEDCDGLAEEADPDVQGAFVTYADVDGDTFGAASTAAPSCRLAPPRVTAAGDCDDADTAVNPDAAEVCDPADADEDCDGLSDEADTDAALTSFYDDDDGDGFGAGPEISACAAPSGSAVADGDCDDTDPAISPAGIEVCGGADEDCDGLVDDADPDAIGTPFFADADGDGFGAGPEILRCDPGVLVDVDGDCDDGDSDVNPAAVEVCDAASTDEDCDGLAEDQDPDSTGGTAFHLDRDGDGHGDPLRTVVACALPAGASLSADDCDDRHAEAHPGAIEVCDALDLDEDCDGSADDADSGVIGATYYTDADGDGFGAGAAADACDWPLDAVAIDGDCDDGDPFASPSAAEVCDASDVDEDCDGSADDADSGALGASAGYADSDGDGFGDGPLVELCDPPVLADVDGDCDDSEAAVNPGAAEVCDASDRDEDCSGEADDDDAGATGQSTAYADADLDGYGAGAAISLCDPPVDAVPTDDDCDDTDENVYPGAPELCDGVDNACGSAWNLADEDGTATLWAPDPTPIVLAGDVTIDGDLWICPGSYSVHLIADGGSIQSRDDDASTVTLDGGASGSALAVDDSAAVVVVRGVRLIGGDDSTVRLDDGELSLVGVELFDGAGVDGGAVFSNGVLTLDTVAIARGAASGAGGGLFATDLADVLATDVDFVDCTPDDVATGTDTKVYGLDADFSCSAGACTP